MGLFNPSPTSRRRQSMIIPFETPPCITAEPAPALATPKLPRCLFLELPPEIRLQIYADLVTAEVPLDLMNLKPPPICRTSRLIRDESLAHFCRLNTFFLRGGRHRSVAQLVRFPTARDNLEMFMAGQGALHPRLVSCMRELRVGLRGLGEVVTITRQDGGAFTLHDGRRQPLGNSMVPDDGDSTTIKWLSDDQDLLQRLMLSIDEVVRKRMESTRFFKAKVDLARVSHLW